MPRFYVGLEDGEKELWKATNVTVEGNFVVMVELSFSGQDAKPLDRYKAAMLALSRDATKRRQLSKYAWVFALEARLNDVFQILVNHLGVEHHSYTVAELKSGEGLAYDAEKRTVCEFYAKNWMDD
jgi:hypothetical protein